MHLFKLIAIINYTATNIQCTLAHCRHSTTQDDV